MTIIHIYDPRAAAAPLTPLPVSALVIAAWNLLEEASDLPHPHYLTISGTQSIDLQFPGDPSSARAITRWALRFGGVLTSEPCEGKSGPQTRCCVQFGYYGVAITAYAYIPAGTATT
jgi:hypothetical protein